MNNPRTDRPAENKPVELPFAEVKRLLLAQLQNGTKDRKSTLKALAFVHAEVRHHDEALEYLRQLQPLESDLEQRAACVLAMGALAEKQEDFDAAIRFYREALAMEPERNDVWYFVNNNLGFSLNKLGQFAEGEKFCRAAIEINSARSNAHKNLGIALAGQGQFVEAAKSYVMATKVAPGDPRSLGLLNEMLKQHAELEFEFGPELTGCEAAVKFAAAAIQRARNGRILKALLACNHPDLETMFTDLLHCMTAGAADVSSVSNWQDFIACGCSGNFDLAFAIPNNMQAIKTDATASEPWKVFVNAVKRIKGNSAVAIIAGGHAVELAKHAQECRNAGADAVVEWPSSLDTLAEAIRRVLKHDQA